MMTKVPQVILQLYKEVQHYLMLRLIRILILGQISMSGCIKSRKTCKYIKN